MMIFVLEKKRRETPKPSKKPARPTHKASERALHTKTRRRSLSHGAPCRAIVFSFVFLNTKPPSPPVKKRYKTKHREGEKQNKSVGV